jgi:beta-lactamase regulating signal transducer with metallopeptidase domain
MMHVLELLGYGAVLSWLALPILVKMAALRAENDPARAHRRLLLALLLSSVCVALPWLRSCLPRVAESLTPVKLSVRVLATTLETHALPRGAVSLSPFALLGGAWALAWLVALLRRVAGFARLRFLLSRARDATASLRQLTADLASELGTATPRVLMSEQASVPFSAGVLTPVIVLPGALGGALPESSLRLVLEHELVHLRRRDPLSHGLTLACGTLFGFHPTASWLLRELLVMREAAVDAQVAKRDLHAYADLLVQMASWVRFGRDFTHVSMDDTALSRRIALLTRPVGKSSGASLRPLLLSSVGIAAVSLLAPSVLADPIPILPGPMPGLSLRTGFAVGQGLDFPGTFDPLAPYQPEIDACYERARADQANLVIDAHATFEVGGNDFRVASAHVPTPQSRAFQSCIEERAVGHWTFPPPPGAPPPPLPFGSEENAAMVSVPIHREP